MQTKSKVGSAASNIDLIVGSGIIHYASLLPKLSVALLSDIPESIVVSSIVSSYFMPHFSARPIVQPLSFVIVVDDTIPLNFQQSLNYTLRWFDWETCHPSLRWENRHHPVNYTGIKLIGVNSGWLQQKGYPNTPHIIFVLRLIMALIYGLAQSVVRPPHQPIDFLQSPLLDQSHVEGMALTSGQMVWWPAFVKIKSKGVQSHCGSTAIAPTAYNVDVFGNPILSSS